MKAVQMNSFGGPEVLKVVEVPTPEPGAGQLLVRVAAAGVNFAETLMRENRYAMTPELPSVLGTEVAGTVAAIGSGVAGVSVGARVAAPLFAAGTFFGGYAEYVPIDAALAVPLPDGLSFENATALMVQGLTASYLTKQVPPAGKCVLISAAAGGVGSLLVQLAKRSGARRVVGAASTDEKRALVRSLGADAAVDYTRPDWIERARAACGDAGPDIVYESVGGQVTRASLELLAPQGNLVVYGALNIQSFEFGVPELLGLIFKNQSLTGFALAPLLTPEGMREALTELFELALRGDVRVNLGGSYSLDGAGDAHRALEERRTTGKLVLVP